MSSSTLRRPVPPESGRAQAAGRHPAAGGLSRWDVRARRVGRRCHPYLTLSDLLFEFDLPDRTDLSEQDRRIRGFFLGSIAGQRIFLDRRGSFQYGSYATVDLHLDRTVPIGRGQLLLAVDAFNVLGASTISEVQTSLTGDVGIGSLSGYGRTLDRIPPRTIRLGLTARR